MPSTSPPRAAWARTAFMIAARAGDRAAAQIVAVREAARQHDEIGRRRQFAVVVPDASPGLTPVAWRRARATSPSRLEPGKTMTAARRRLVIVRWRSSRRSVLASRFSQASSSSSRARSPCRRRRSRCRKSCPGARWRRRRRQALERALDRLALRIEHALFQGDDDARFHELHPAREVWHGLVFLGLAAPAGKRKFFGGRAFFSRWCENAVIRVVKYVTPELNGASHNNMKAKHYHPESVRRGADR